MHDRYQDPPPITTARNKRRPVNMFGEKGPEKSAVNLNAVSLSSLVTAVRPFVTFN